MKKTRPGPKSASVVAKSCVGLRGGAVAADDVGQRQRDRGQEQREGQDQRQRGASGGGDLAGQPAQVGVGGAARRAAGSTAVASETVAIACGTITSRNEPE